MHHIGGKSFFLFRTLVGYFKTKQNIFINGTPL